jgi:hypothetical protein
MPLETIPLLITRKSDNPNTSNERLEQFNQHIIYWDYARVLRSPGRTSCRDEGLDAIANARVWEQPHFVKKIGKEVMPLEHFSVMSLAADNHSRTLAWGCLLSF